MALGFKNDGNLTHEYIYDFSVDGGAVSEISLSGKSGQLPVPVGAFVQSVKLQVLTAFTSGGAATLAWGNGDDADGYSGAAIAVASLTAGSVFNGWDNGAALIWDDANDHPIDVNVADALDGKVSVSIAGAAMTAGKAVLLVEYAFPKG